MSAWKVLNEYKEGTNIIDYFINRLNLEIPSAKEDFLYPPAVRDLLKTLPADFRTSLKQAADLIRIAMTKGIPIIIHGDYDADGICATAILYNTLSKELNYKKVFYFIPNRFSHGYGFSNESIISALESVENSLNEKPANVLFISVDSGITAVSEVDFIKSLGHQVIITDHHQKPSVLPKAECIVWYDQVVGSTISWLLSRVLGSKDVQSIGLATIATITDLQPILNFNRSLVKEGLEVLNSNPPLGIKKLLEVSGKSSGELTSYDLGWVIGPRLNASGRMIEATDALKLLLETEEHVLEVISQKLNEVNSIRQDKTLEMFEIAKIVEMGKLPKIIFSYNENYHEGIIGLVAARLVQAYYRPAIVISIKEGFGKGSVRSVPGIDIISILRNFEDLFVNLGGHPMAAGFTISLDKLPVLERSLYEYAEKQIEDFHLKKTLEIDLKIPGNLVNCETISELDKLRPYGIGNTEPVFMISDLGVASVNIVGRESRHLAMKLFDGTRILKAIYFGGAENADLAVGDIVDVAFTLKRNSFNGFESVDLIVKDLVKSNR